MRSFSFGKKYTAFKIVAEIKSIIDLMAKGDAMNVNELREMLTERGYILPSPRSSIHR